MLVTAKSDLQRILFGHLLIVHHLVLVLEACRCQEYSLSCDAYVTVQVEDLAGYESFTAFDAVHACR